MSIANVKKGETVILHMFTGIAVGVKEVIAADKKTITIETRSGEAVFDRKTGKQISPEAKSEKYANYVTEDDGSFVPKGTKEKGKKKSSKVAEEPKSTKKSKAKSKKAKDEDEDDDDDYEDAE